MEVLSNRCHDCLVPLDEDKSGSVSFVRNAPMAGVGEHVTGVLQRQGRTQQEIGEILVRISLNVIDDDDPGVAERSRRAAYCCLLHKRDSHKEHFAPVMIDPYM